MRKKNFVNAIISSVFSFYLHWIKHSQEILFYYGFTTLSYEFNEIFFFCLNFTCNGRGKIDSNLSSKHSTNLQKYLDRKIIAKMCGCGKTKGRGRNKRKRTKDRKRWCCCETGIKLVLKGKFGKTQNKREKEEREMDKN